MHNSFKPGECQWFVAYNTEPQYEFINLLLNCTQIIHIRPFHEYNMHHTGHNVLRIPHRPVKRIMYEGYFSPSVWPFCYPADHTHCVSLRTFSQVWISFDGCTTACLWIETLARTSVWKKLCLRCQKKAISPRCGHDHTRSPLQTWDWPRTCIVFINSGAESCCNGHAFISTNYVKWTSFS